MNKADTSVKDSNSPESSNKAVIINSLTNYLTNDIDISAYRSDACNLAYQSDPLFVTVPKAESLPGKYEKFNLNDGDSESDGEKIFTSLKTVEFTNQNVKELNTSKGSEDFEELVNLEDVKNIEELESFKKSQNFEESIDLEEIKNIEKTQALEISQTFEESVNFEDIKNIEESVIIELDNFKLSQIQNSTQKCILLVDEIPSQKSKNDKQSTNSQKCNLINSNFTENNNHEVTFTSLQNFENTSERENDQNLSNPILQLSNNESSNNLRERIKKRNKKIKKEVTETETKDNESEVADQKVKSINNDVSEIIFIRPIIPDKFHNTKKCCVNNNTDEQNISLSSPTLSVLQKNLTDEDKMRLNSTEDIISNSDNEFEEICNFIKNGSYDPAQLSMDTLDLLGEFNEIDQSTNEKLLADLLNSPIRISDQIQEDSRRMSTPEIKEDTEDIFEISLKNKETNDEESNILEPVEDQMRDNNSEEMADDLVNAQIQSENKEVSSPCKDDDSSYNNIDESSSAIGSSSEIDIEELKEQAKKAKKSFIIKKEVREKLAKFTVRLKHEVPPQHKLERTLRMPPSRPIQSLFEEHIPMKKGTYTADEDKIIKENWEYFCHVNRWNSADIKPFLQFRYKGKPMMKQKEALKFSRFIARGLPSRSLFSVMARFRRLFRDTSRKIMEKLHYTAKEDKIIWAYFKDEKIHHQDGVGKLAKLLDRPYASVFYRWQALKSKGERELFLSQKNIRKRVDWDISLVGKFLKKLMKLTLSENIEELKDAKIPPIIWKKLERTMKISINCLKSLWSNRLHAQLFYERPFFLNDIKVLLIEYMYVKGITNREEINWSEIGELFDGIPIKYLMKVFYWLEKNTYLRMKTNLGDIIDWLYKYRINRIKLLRKEKYLPGIIYKDGAIEVIHRSYSTVLDGDINNSSEDIC